MARVKLRCIMGCRGLKSSYREKGLLCLSICRTILLNVKVGLLNAIKALSRSVYVKVHLMHLLALLETD